mmetsp:Transcript_37413/g.89803  ORF Transcript_37413/g.89803 Transcript_37413/m.89803 type:complete len:250 (-) Transcript_37413:513-1262(-)
MTRPSRLRGRTRGCATCTTARGSWAASRRCCTTTSCYCMCACLTTLLCSAACVARSTRSQRPAAAAAAVAAVVARRSAGRRRPPRSTHRRCLTSCRSSTRTRPFTMHTTRCGCVRSEGGMRRACCSTSDCSCIQRRSRSPLGWEACNWPRGALTCCATSQSCARGYGCRWRGVPSRMRTSHQAVRTTLAVRTSARRCAVWWRCCASATCCGWTTCFPSFPTSRASTTSSSRCAPRSRTTVGRSASSRRR